MEPLQRSQPTAAPFTRSLNGQPGSVSRPMIRPVRGRSVDGVYRSPVTRPAPVTPVMATAAPAPTPAQPVVAAPQPVTVPVTTQPPQPVFNDVFQPAPAVPAEPVVVRQPVQAEPISAPQPVQSDVMFQAQPQQLSADPVTSAPRPQQLPYEQAKLVVEPKQSFFNRLKHMERRAISAVAIIASVLVLGGGSAAAYYGQVVPNRPDNILAQALANTVSGTADSQAFAATISSANFEFKLNGSSAPNGIFSLTADTTVNGQSGRFEALSADGKQMYVRGTDVAALASGKPANNDQAALIQSIMKVYAPLLQKVNGQWYQFGSPAILSEADQTALANIYRQNSFLNIIAIKEDEKVGELDSYHYQVAVDGDKLRGFLIGMKDENISAFKLTQDKLSLINQAIQATDFSKRPIDIWINKTNKQVSQLAVNSGGISLQVTMSDFGKPVDVTAPSGAKPSSDLYDTLQGIRSSDALYNSGLMTGDNTVIGVLLMTAMH